MLSLPPSQPTSPPPSPPPPSPRQPRQPSPAAPLNPVVRPNQDMKALILAPRVPRVRTNKVPLQRPRRTNPAVWCGAIICLIFSLCLICFGVVTLVIFLAVKPRSPVFDIPAASLSVVYFDSPDSLNGNFILLTNFSNPNRKLNVRFEHAEIELYFSNSLISSQALQPFTERRGEARLVPVHMISSLVYLPPNHAIELQKQVQSNKIEYNVRGTFRIRANLGLIHFSYWLHGRCQLEITGPPTGFLLARNCRTKR
ncbi:hypothetical protein NMG60_11037447 [Bertholletia excelsa]